ncbi:hypothetical protein HPB49_020038 [Dermacentor silvarum]|uniref:Uncharacterized protein n=1 Tax=Dermacentor silvarum TaxID=543639 RepID=A0ACB8D874_DERSI|nr:hypothetical protein HPB49_020038 [Dermacentor silvarum]
MYFVLLVSSPVDFIVNNGSTAFVSTQARNLWTEKETTALIDHWRDRLSDLNQKRNARVYHEIADVLLLQGFRRTAAEVKNKIRNLTQLYRFQEHCVDSSSKVLTSDTSDGLSDVRSNAYDDKWLEGHHLPQFSSEVQPLLLGHPLTREEHHKLAKQFRREIIDFLNEHNLITDTSSGGRRWKYHYLGLSLAFQFPKLHWDFRGSRASHGDHSKAKAKFLSKLAEARRHQLARAKSREITAHIEPSS